MISARDEKYIDSLYSNYHVQFSNEELLLPIQYQQATLYPTVLHKPSGLATHIEKSPEKSAEPASISNRVNVTPVPFHPSNFVSANFNKRLSILQEPPKKSRPTPSVPRILSSQAPPGTNLYEATYAGVEVYELIIGSNSIMRRRESPWVNATHILKVC